MEQIESIQQLWEKYHRVKNDIFDQRYLSLETLNKAFKGLSNLFTIKSEGASVMDRDIRSVCFGTGRIKILMWSQMHGNETTTTKAVFDLLRTFEILGHQDFLQKISATCTIKLIPVLNPDGAHNYTRNNANDIDLNRDAQSLSQPESRILASVFNDFKPDFCFNLHDQRSIYSAGDRDQPAVVSFLAPSFNAEKTVNHTREISMKLLGELNGFLQTYIPHQIGRYDDQFNANCVGDRFQSLKVPTVLFEAGHFPGDYQRERVRKLIYIALMKSLESIASNNYPAINTSKYHEIPRNKKLFFDILLRNVLLNEYICSVAIQYREELSNKKIKFIPIIEKFGDLPHFYGHREIDAKQQPLTVNGATNIHNGMKVDSLWIGNDKIMLKLNQS